MSNIRITEASLFTCRGAVRGECGVTHWTLAGAERCCERDRRAIRSGMRAGWLGGGSYSDRRPVAIS